VATSNINNEIKASAPHSMPLIQITAHYHEQDRSYLAIRTLKLSIWFNKLCKRVTNNQSLKRLSSDHEWSNTVITKVTCDASMYDVNLLSCSRGWTFPKKTEVEPEPQVALERVNSIHSRPRILKRTKKLLSKLWFLLIITNRNNRRLKHHFLAGNIASVWT
jgi:hypothetical protein